MTRVVKNISMTAILVTVAAFGMSSVVHAEGERPAPVSFAEIDANNDGQVDKAELTAHAKARRAARAAAHFAKVDTNSDGFLSVEELKASGEDRAAKRAERMIKHLDTNEDGQLSAEELSERGKGHGKKTGGKKHGHKKDGAKQDGHKKDGHKEGRKGGKDRGAKLIERFDTDGNGTLSEDEFAAASEAMAKHKGHKQKKQGE